MKTILVVEDERDIRELICHHLRKEGFKPLDVPDAETGLAEVQKRLPDGVVLDLMLPGMQGMEFCRLLRNKERTAKIPILMVTAKSDEIDKLLGFELGADDYITKPFSPRELVARMKAILRRSADVPGPAQTPPYENDTLHINFANHQVLVRGTEVSMSPTEFKLLRHFVTHPEMVFSRDQLLDAVWGLDTYVMPRTVDVHIQKLRTLIEEDSRHPQMILTVRGAGYKFSPKLT